MKLQRAYFNEGQYAAGPGQAGGAGRLKGPSAAREEVSGAALKQDLNKHPFEAYEMEP